MHNITDKQRDRWTDAWHIDANSRSYCVAVRSAKNLKFISDLSVMVSVIFRPHGRRMSSNLRYFPSLSLTQTLYTVIYLTQRAKIWWERQMWQTLLQNDDWTSGVWRWGNDTNMW